MSVYKNRYELITSKCSLIKDKILDIGSQNGKALLIFNQNGFKNLIGIDTKININSSSNLFVEYLIQNNELKYENNYFHFESSPTNKYKSIFEVFKVIRDNPELHSRFTKLQSEICLIPADFTNSPVEFIDIKKFNLVMCSFVLHFYPQTKDAELIRKLKSLLHPDGYLYIKVHNRKRFNTYKNTKTDKELAYIEYDKTLNTINDCNKGETVIWYLFDNTRIEGYIKSFKLIYQNLTSNDFYEIILQNNK